MATPTLQKVFVTNCPAGVWTQVLSGANGSNIVGYKLKTRFTFPGPPVSFDYAFNSAPAAGATTTGNGFLSNTGPGAGDSTSPRNGIWVRPRTTTLVEVTTYS